MSILQFLLSHYKIPLLTFSYVLYDAVSLGNRHSTFRNTLFISYSSVKNIKNISLPEGVFASFSEMAITNYPVARRHFFFLVYCMLHYGK